MSGLRADLRAVVEQLLEASESSREVSLDALGDAIGLLPVSFPEIDAMIDELEAAGRTVTAPHAMKGEELLRSVLASLRVLSPQLGRKPTYAEIVEHSGLSLDEVRHALRLAQIMQR